MVALQIHPELGVIADGETEASRRVGRDAANESGDFRGFRSPD
jgi:hypothetical protein